MIQQAHGARFAFEALHAGGIGGEFLRKNFECYRAAQARVPAAVHFRHSTGAQRFDYLVIAGANSGQERHRDSEYSAGIRGHTTAFRFTDWRAAAC